MLLNKKIGAVLILAGTCIGAGMLALPVSTAPTGFALGLVLLVSLWAFMYLTGLLVLEANLWFDREVSYISMARETLGNTAKWLTWLFFLLLLYSLMTAYIMGGSAILETGSQTLLHWNMPHWLGVCIWSVIFAGIIYFGASSVDVINKLFMFGLVAAFAVLAAVISPHMHFIIETHTHPYAIWLALPIVITSFGYHIVVPSMTQYLKRDTRTLQRVILFGSVLPLLVYLVWQYIVFGNIPVNGSHGLARLLHHGDPASGLTADLASLTGSTWVGISARAFAIFALASSFIGVALGLFDLLADGCNIQKTAKGKLGIGLLTFVPPIIFTLAYPHGFLIALSYAGLFVAIIHGILPAAMVWSGRYHRNLATGYRVWIGKLGLIIVFIVSCVVIFAQLYSNWH